jgi:Tol biopolymer transport system component
VSVGAAKAQANGRSYQPDISADGRYVTFASPATNLVAGDTNGTTDVFRRDLTSGVTVRVSTGSGTGGSQDPSISADGRYVAFSSDAAGLVPGDTNGAQDLFVRDLSAGTTVRVSVASGGTQGTGPAPCFCFVVHTPSISADGRYVAFSSDFDNLVPGDTNHTGDVFVHDLVSGITTRF